MKVVKIRHVGNSDVMTVPPELGLQVGSAVLVEKLDTGQILITPAESIRQRMPAIAARVAKRNREAFRILEEHDHQV